LEQIRSDGGSVSATQPSFTKYVTGHGGGTTLPLARDEGAEEFRRDPTVGPHPKVWTEVKNGRISSAKDGVPERFDTGQFRRK